MSIETTIETTLAYRLGIVIEPEILGYAIEEFDIFSKQSLGYVQKLKFKLDVMKLDNTSLNYSRITAPTLKTKLETYAFDEFTAQLLMSIFGYYPKSVRLCFVLKCYHQGKDKILITPVNELDN